MNTVPSSAQQAAAPPELQQRVFKNAQGETLPYQLHVPPANAAKPYALLLFLHGAGERGDDNRRQLKNGEVLRLVQGENRTEHPCLFVAPQCPANSKWADVVWSQKTPHVTAAEPAKPMQLLIALLDQLEKEFPVDPRRRYITGLSMGGFGTMDLLVRQPERWAAAVPICGGADNRKADTIAQIPIWIFHGGADGVVPTERSRSLVEAIKQAGGSPKYTEYPGVGHNSWSKAYREPGLAEWLFAQRKK